MGCSGLEDLDLEALAIVTNTPPRSYSIMASTPGFLPGNPSSNLGSFTLMNRFGCTRDGKIRQNNQGMQTP